MKLVIIDLYGDGETLRVCEDTPGIDQIIAEFANDEESEEHFDEFMERKGIQLFITRLVSLERFQDINCSRGHPATRRSP